MAGIGLRIRLTIIFFRRFFKYGTCRHLTVRFRRCRGSSSYSSGERQRIARGDSDPWSDFSQPSTMNDDPAWAARIRERQLRYAREIRSLLDVPGNREEFAKFIGRSLALSEGEVIALFWEAPRSLMTEVLPTLLRRLERDWQRADGSGNEHFISRSPLPEFVPRALFSDLQLPELSVRVPEQQPGQFRIELMPVAQGLREFAPGRVSRRFGVRHGRQRYWISPGPGGNVLIDSYCSSAARQDLGLFRYVDTQGTVSQIRVFRPYVIDTSLPPADIQQSSNSFLHWRTEVVVAALGEHLDLPTRSYWGSVIQAVRIHTHQLGIPVELRRFAGVRLPTLHEAVDNLNRETLHFRRCLRRPQYPQRWASLPMSMP